MIIFALSFAVMSITFLYANSSYNSAMLRSYFTSTGIMLMNFLPIFLLMAFIYVISARLWAGFAITGSLFLFVSFINKSKLLYRDDPFTTEDLKLFKESLIMADKYRIRPDFLTWLFIAFIAVTAILLKLYHRTGLRRKTRLFSVVALGMAGFITFGGFYFNPDIYNALGDKTLINTWKYADHFRSKGFVYPFLYSIKGVREETVVEGYDEQKAISYINEFEYRSIPSGQKVNMIIVMLEAYNDFSQFEGVELNVDIYENFHKLQEESLSGKLISNVFAGNTINTERSFLTGFTYNPEFQIKTNSIVWYFRQQGYRTEAMHPITGNFYNRASINKLLGFNEFHHYDNRYRYVQKEYLEDYDFFDYIIEGYEKSRKKNRPYFNFSVTYQNHGPYFSDRRTDVDYLKKREHYDEATYNIINNYFSGIAKTDRAIKKLVDYFRDKDPTIVVFFGDHNPWLGQDAVGYEMLGINLDISTLEGFRNYYATPYIVWANEAARKVLKRDFRGEGNDVSPIFLMAEIFDYIGWKGNQYMQFLIKLKGMFDVVHKVFYKENGKYVTELSADSAKMLNDFRSVEQYVRYNFLEKP